jgi:hypothetical protein
MAMIKAIPIVHRYCLVLDLILLLIFSVSYEFVEGRIYGSWEAAPLDTPHGLQHFISLVLSVVLSVVLKENLIDKRSKESACQLIS